MARKPPRKPHHASPHVAPAPGVAIDAGQVSAVFEFRVIVAGEAVFGTGLIEGDLDRHPDLMGIGERVAPQFRALLEAIAVQLGGAVVDLGRLEPVDGAVPTVVSGRSSGRA